MHVSLTIQLPYRIATGTSQDVSGRFALSHQWDEEEPRLLVCEAKLLPKPGKSKISVPVSEPSPGTSWSRRASSSTMTVLAPSDFDQKNKVSAEKLGRGIPKFSDSEEF